MIITFIFYVDSMVTVLCKGLELPCFFNSLLGNGKELESQYLVRLTLCVNITWTIFFFLFVNYITFMYCSSALTFLRPATSSFVFQALWESTC